MGQRPVARETARWQARSSAAVPVVEYLCAQRLPYRPAQGTERVVRGGSFAGVDKRDKPAPDEDDLRQRVHPFLRSAARYSLPSDVCYAIVGFRVVLGPELAGEGR